MKTKFTQFINKHPYLFGALTLASLTLIAYDDVIFGPSNIIISHPGSDISLGLQNLVFSFSTPHFPTSSKATIEKDTVTLIDQSPNWLDIKATTTNNAVLLVTDAYAKGWKVFPYADSSQQKYEVMPADYVLRGIPISPGTHHFRLQYAPEAFYRGRTISLIALAFYLLAWCGLLGSEWRKKDSNNEQVKK